MDANAGDGQQQSATGTPAGPDPAPLPAGAGGPVSPPSAAARPDFIPEKFWDPATGTPRVEQLAKSYGELEKQRAKFADEARAAVTAEMFGKRPEKPDAYEVGLPEDVADLVVLTDKPGADFKAEPGKSYWVLPKDDPLLAMGRQLAHRAGMDQAEFAGMLAQFGKAMAVRVPSAEERQAADTAVFQQLGEHGERRVQHVWGQLRSVLGEEKAAVLDGMVGSAAAVEALEMLVERAGAPRFSPPTGAASGRLSEAELREKMRDPRYADPTRRDPAFVAEVQRGWKTLYPN
jgi:hypothetical protein